MMHKLIRGEAAAQPQALGLWQPEVQWASYPGVISADENITHYTCCEHVSEPQAARQGPRPPATTDQPDGALATHVLKILGRRLPQNRHPSHPSDGAGALGGV